MAKDRRATRGQTSARAKKPGGTATSSAKKRKRKIHPGKVVLIVLLCVLIVVSLIFIFLVGRNIYDTLTNKNEVPQVDLDDYDTTPQTDKDKVAYYLVGLLGDEETLAPTDMLSLVCYDKAAKSINVLQVPQNTYLGGADSWAVEQIGDVWYNPKPLDWCDFCRKQIFAPEIAEGKHTVCGNAVTQRTGSSVENLLQAFNDQYSMPIDNYFMLQKDTLIKLIDLVGGVDVDLPEKIKLGEISFQAGVQTLDGASAYEYISKKGDNVKADLDRLTAQRQVFVALLQRLGSKSAEDLEENIIGPLMNGSTPIRSATDTDSVLALLQSPTKADRDEWYSSKYDAALADLLVNMGKVPLENSAIYLMPGEATKFENVEYFSLYKASLANLLQTAFNPYGRTLSEADLQLLELVPGKEGDLRKQTFAELAVGQTGEATTTTTTAAAAE